MDRRAFLKTAAGAGALTAAGGLATPAISQRASARALRFVPIADLSNFDPIWNVRNPVRDAGLLVWDTLYGVDAKLQPQRQMVKAEEVSPDGLAWTFRLRPGLKFHDGEPVLAKDAVASINRWSARDAMGAKPPRSGKCFLRSLTLSSAALMRRPSLRSRPWRQSGRRQSGRAPFP
jgi:peptide/nickel transport system substrate-binding protein